MFIVLSRQLTSRLPLLIAAVIGLAFILLTVVFHAPVIAVKPAVLNVLSVGAAYGAIVAVFQFGWLKGIIGLRETIPIISFVPMFVFAIVFGLSMDYEVFLVSRIREEHLYGKPMPACISTGFGAISRVITSAALIMAGVFGSFILSNNATIKMFGFGLAFAILVDAFVVRLALVPAVLTLLGERSWWRPRWLERALPALDVEGRFDPRPQAELARPVFLEPQRAGD